MTFPLLWLIVCAASYLLGSVPFGYLLGRLLHRKDIRSGGSGNIGATNALRQFGAATGVLVLLFDLLKGFCVAWLCLRVIPACFPALFDVPIDPFVALLPALMVMNLSPKRYLCPSRFTIATKSIPLDLSVPNTNLKLPLLLYQLSQSR
jgi:glycerol-3-phosphate acyltransferase PlsY